jgi:myo-inositol-1(or 4)-monophosphatase
MTKLLDELIKLVKKAGSQMLDVCGVNTDSDITEKSGTANFVTVYDVKIQTFLIEGIKALCPDAYFISEEKENDPLVLQKEFCFVIDPIDGTTNFIRDLHLSSVSVAMLSKGEATLGIVYHPYSNEIFYAEKGLGAFCNGKPIRVSDRAPSEALVAFGTSPYTKLSNFDITMPLATELLLSCADLRRLGSAALDLAYVAAGRFDMFFETVLSPWDYAAGQLLIKEAGGKISDMQGNTLTFDAPRSVIAANPQGYPFLLEKAKKYYSI